MPSPQPQWLRLLSSLRRWFCCCRFNVYCCSDCYVFCVWSLFRCTVLSVISGFAIISQQRKIKLSYIGMWSVIVSIFTLPSEKFFMLFCRLLIILIINFFEKFFQEYLQCQTNRTQVRPDVLSGLIRVYSVSIGKIGRH